MEKMKLIEIQKLLLSKKDEKEIMVHEIKEYALLHLVQSDLQRNQKKICVWMN
jgi:hypothetical protein